MAQWTQIINLANTDNEVSKRLLNIYTGNRFPIDVRGQLAESVEAADWPAMESDNVSAARLHFNNIVGELEMRIRSMPHSNAFTNRMQLQQARESIIVEYGENMESFIRVMQKCMRDEKMLIESCQTEGDDRRAGAGRREEAREDPILAGKINNFRNQLNAADTELNEFNRHQANFRLEYTTYTDMIETARQKVVPNGMERQYAEKEIHKMEQDRNQKATANFNMRTNVGAKHMTLTTSLGALIQDVWKEIDAWKNDLKLAFTGLSKPKEGALQILDGICFTVNGFLLDLLNQVDKTLQLFNELKYESPDLPDEWIPKMEKTGQQLNILLEQHLSKIFLVDHCPRVLKVITQKSSGFVMSCRFLGAHAFSLQSPPRVTAELHREADLTTALREYCKKGICDIMNGKDKQMDFHRVNKQYVGNFSSVQLLKVKSFEKSQDKLVMERLYGMVFYTHVKIRDKAFCLTALSPPMGLISHVLQDCMARAFLIWDSAFSKPDGERKPFEHPEEVEWPRVAAVLNALFKMNTGKGLDENQLNYLGRVAFRDRVTGDYTKRTINKGLLIRDRLHRDFTFWKWFYANMNVIKEKLMPEWEAGLIHGFISKEEIMEKLEQCEPGTFMLRFSERSIENSARADICGCLTMAVVEIDPKTERKKIYHVKEHLMPKDIHDRGLGATLQAFEVLDYRDQRKRPLLRYLYPDRDFRTTFGPLIPGPKTEADDGYKSGKLRIEIFLTDETDGLPPRDPRITLPMSPISSVGGVTSPGGHSYAGSDLDDSSLGAFSPASSTGAAARFGCIPGAGNVRVAMVPPQQAGGGVFPNPHHPVYGPTADLQRMNLNGPVYDPSSSPQEAQITVNTLPQNMERMLDIVGDAANGLLSMDSGDIGSSAGTSGNSAMIDSGGDMELDESMLQNIISDLGDSGGRGGRVYIHP